MPSAATRSPDPHTGPQVAEVIASLYATPADVVARVADVTKRFAKKKKKKKSKK